MKQHILIAAALLFALAFTSAASAKQRIKLDPAMVTSEAAHGTPAAMVDEQDQTGSGDSPSGEPTKPWEVPSQHWKTIAPVSAYIDLGQDRFLASLWICDTNGVGDIIISIGKPGAWSEELSYDCKAYKHWVELPLSAKTRYLRFTRKDGGSNFTEIVFFEQTAEEHAAAIAKKEAEGKERAAREAAAAKAKAERDAGVARAQQELKDRPVIDLGEPFGKLTLVDQIDVAAPQPGHLFAQNPDGVSSGARRWPTM